MWLISDLMSFLGVGIFGTRSLPGGCGYVLGWVGVYLGVGMPSRWACPGYEYVQERYVWEWVPMGMGIRDVYSGSTPFPSTDMGYNGIR